MKRALALAVMATLAVACTTRVIEQPAPPPTVVTAPQPPMVVTTPPATTQQPAASGATAAPACVWAGQPYSTGSLTCQNNGEFRCNAGTWERTNSTACQ